MILELAAIACVLILAYRTFRLPRASTPENILVDTVIKSLRDNPFDWEVEVERGYDESITYTKNKKTGVELRENHFYHPASFKPSLFNRVRLDFARSGLQIVLDSKKKEDALQCMLKGIGNVAN